MDLIMLLSPRTFAFLVLLPLRIPLSIFSYPILLPLPFLFATLAFVHMLWSITLYADSQWLIIHC